MTTFFKAFETEGREEMSILISKGNVKRYAHELDLALRFRHEFFVDGMGWEHLRKPDGREVDIFDEDAVHVVEIVQDKAVAYTRLLPTTRPHLLSHLYPELLQGVEEPIGPNVWEQGRGTLVKRRLPNGMPNPLSAKITLSIIETALFVGADFILTETHPLGITRALDIGYRPEVLAPPLEIYGQPLVALKFTIDAKTLDTARRFYDHWAPVVYYNGQAVLDLIRPRAVA